jgi:4-hydroxy-2-oxoheptanedioate aldolase
VRENRAKTLVDAGRPAFGAWLCLSSSIAAEHMAHVGWDWLVVDTEHTAIHVESMLHCFRAISTTDTTPMARVAHNDPTLIKQALDTGALGVVVPMVMNASEAERAARASRYPPVGARSIALSARATLYGADYLDRANDEVAVIVQIEHIDAVSRAEEILSVPGVDLGFVGPSDLAWSMGVDPGCPEHEAAIAQTLAAARRVGRPMGILTPGGTAARLRAEQGFLFVGAGSDLGHMKSAAADAVKSARGS